MEFERRKKIHTHLDIAPLIDVVFLLLIFFMLSSRFITQTGIKVTLPAATIKEVHPLEKIILYITEDDNIYLNEKRINLSHLLPRLKTELNESLDKSIIIKADEKVNLGLAVKVMDIAKRAGAKNLIISTKITE